MHDIVKNLRRLSFSGAEVAEPFDMVKVVRTGPKPVEVRMELPDSLEVAGHGGHIHQVIVNLVENVLDAVEGVNSPDAYVSVTQKDGNAIVIVRDNGCDNDEEAILRVFNPFFTTKSVGDGSGLGLWISYDITCEHGGDITAESALGSGTTFALSLLIDGVLVDCGELRRFTKLSRNVRFFVKVTANFRARNSMKSSG